MSSKKKRGATTASPNARTVQKPSKSSCEMNESSEEGTMSVYVAVSSLIAAVAAVIYIYTLYPSIPGGDSGELIAVAHELGVSHPPGYPLFTILAWLVIQIVPFGTVAWRVNLLNAVFSSAAAFFLSMTILRLTHSVGAAILGVFLWCFCRLTWMWSITAEVFGLNNLFVTLLLYLMLVFDEADRSDKPQIARLGAFVCGLSLCNQHTMVVYVAVIGAWVLLTLHYQKALGWYRVVQIGFFFLYGLVPYGYLPVSAYFRPGRWTWGDQTTIAGFLKHFLRQEYGTFDLGKGFTDAGLLINLRSYLYHLLVEFSMVGAVLIVTGFVAMLYRHVKTKGRILTVSTAMMLVYLLFFSWRANLDVENPLFFGVVERFWMQCDCIIILLAAVGYSDLNKYLYKYFPWKYVRLELGLAVAIAAFQIQKNFVECNQRENTVVHEFGARMLENMPPNALVLTKGDLPSNTLRYLYLCENMRPDLLLFDQEILTYPWSVPMMRAAYPRIQFPGYRMSHATGQLVTGERVFSFSTFLDANYNRSPIVACIGVQEHDLSWQRHYKQFPYGPCRLLIKSGVVVELGQWYHHIFNMSSGWTHPYEGFDERSWETVANNEMWQAKIGLALHMYETSLKTQDVKLATEYMVQSYKMYSVAMETNDPIPTYWYKNFALACERMLPLEHDLDKHTILNQAIKNIQKYIELAPDDPDRDKIERAIKHLKSYLKDFPKRNR